MRPTPGCGAGRVCGIAVGPGSCADKGPHVCDDDHTLCQGYGSDITQWPVITEVCPLPTGCASSPSSTLHIGPCGQRRGALLQVRHEIAELSTAVYTSVDRLRAARPGADLTYSPHPPCGLARGEVRSRGSVFAVNLIRRSDR